MLDHLPLHVDDPQRPIGAVGKLYRAKPDVAGGDQLVPHVHPLSPHARAVRPQSLAVHEVAPHVSHHEHAAKVAHRIAPHDRDAGGAGEIPRWPAAPFHDAWHDPAGPQPRSQHPPRLHRADPEDLRLRPLHGDALAAGRCGVVRIPPQRAVIEHAADRMVAVAADIAVAAVVKRHAVLAAAGFWSQVARPRIEGEVAAPQAIRLADRLTILHPPHLAPA